MLTFTFTLLPTTTRYPMSWHVRSGTASLEAAAATAAVTVPHCDWMSVARCTRSCYAYMLLLEHHSTCLVLITPLLLRALGGVIPGHCYAYACYQAWWQSQHAITAREQCQMRV